MPANNLLDELIQATTPISTDVAFPEQNVHYDAYSGITSRTPFNELQSLSTSALPEDYAPNIVASLLPSATKSFSDFIDRLGILDYTKSDLLYPLSKTFLKEYYDRARIVDEEPIDVKHLVKLAKMWSESDKPGVELKKVSGREGRAWYSPEKPGVEHKMRLPAGEKEMYETTQEIHGTSMAQTRLLYEFLAELSHAKSYGENTPAEASRHLMQFPFRLGKKLDKFTKRMFPSSILETDIYDKSYDVPGTEEHYAHKVVQPELAKYLYGANIPHWYKWRTGTLE